MPERPRDARPIGIIANPMSGRDVRRMVGRASTVTREVKRDQIVRAVVGAAAAGAERIVLAGDTFGICRSAVEHLHIHASVDLLDAPPSPRGAEDTRQAARDLREEGCAALVVLGGDGTHRDVASAWSDAPLVPISTGTNNVFPQMLEATLAGAAAGLVAAGGVGLDEAARPAKAVRVAIEGEKDDLALVDAAHLVDDHLGNLTHVDPGKLRSLVLARAEPAAIGLSPIGGLLCPAGADDDFGVAVRCAGPDEESRRLRIPITAGFYCDVAVTGWQRLGLGESVTVEGPGLLAFDGDRARGLEPEQSARLAVRRDGPRVIDTARTLQLAAERDLYLDRSHWLDALGDRSLSCC